MSCAMNNDDTEHLFAVALGKSVSVFVLLCNQELIMVSSLDTSVCM